MPDPGRQWIPELCHRPVHRHRSVSAPGFPSHPDSHDPVYPTSDTRFPNSPGLSLCRNLPDLFSAGSCLPPRQSRSGQPDMAHARPRGEHLFQGFVDIPIDRNAGSVLAKCSNLPGFLSVGTAFPVHEDLYGTQQS